MSLAAGIFKTATSNADFSWSCNPANADTEVILSEMIRTQIGLPNDFGYGYGGLGKFVMNFNEAIVLTLHTSQMIKKS